MKHKKRSAGYPTEINKSEYCLLDHKIKRKYKTQLDAELSAVSKEQQQYICQFCGFWHNGRSSRSQNPFNQSRSNR